LFFCVLKLGRPTLREDRARRTRQTRRAVALRRYALTRRKNAWRLKGRLSLSGVQPAAGAPVDRRPRWSQRTKRPPSAWTLEYAGEPPGFGQSYRDRCKSSRSRSRGATAKRRSRAAFVDRPLPQPGLDAGELTRRTTFFVERPRGGPPDSEQPSSTAACSCFGGYGVNDSSIRVATRLRRARVKRILRGATEDHEGKRSWEFVAVYRSAVRPRAHGCRPPLVCSPRPCISRNALCALPLDQ